jgi:uncharacterized protein (DUF433 family)
MEFPAIEVPIKIDQNGVARVGGTRVTLETVIGAFKDGIRRRRLQSANLCSD